MGSGPPLTKFGISAGTRFDSGRNPVNSNQYGFEPIDLPARVLKLQFPVTKANKIKSNYFKNVPQARSFFTEN